jgi:hypothetical protein
MFAERGPELFQDRREFVFTSSGAGVGTEVTDAIL